MLTMGIQEEMEQLLDQDEGDLGQITRELLILLDQTVVEDITLPPALLLDVILQANYVLGYGGTIEEVRGLATGLDQVLSSDEELDSAKVNRLGCTLASAVISQITSDQYEGSTPEELLPWEDSTDIAIQLHSLTRKLLSIYSQTEPNSWSLELLGFIVTLILLQNDMGQTFKLSDEHRRQVSSVVNAVQGTPVYDSWKEEWLEKSDYYRFVTLMLTQSSRDEEIWVDYIQNLVKGI